MDDFADTMKAISRMIDDGNVDADLLGDLDLPTVFSEIAGLVSAELMHLQGLGDDPDENENALRQTIQNAATKAFFAGLAVGGSRAGDMDDALVVPVPAEALEAIGLAAIRDGMVTFHLVSPAAVE